VQVHDLRNTNEPYECCKFTEYTLHGGNMNIGKVKLWFFIVSLLVFLASVITLIVIAFDASLVVGLTCTAIISVICVFIVI
jgi:hypothetical protein